MLRHPVVDAPLTMLALYGEQVVSMLPAVPGLQININSVTNEENVIWLDGG